MLPAAVLLLLFLTYPLGLGVWLGFTDTKIGRAGEWIGLENYEFLWGDSVTRLALFNTLFYTVVASVLKFVLGLWLALLLNQHMPFKSFFRAVVLLPFIVPTALSAIAFWWIYDAQFSIISWALVKMGLIDHYIDFLGEPVERALRRPSPPTSGAACRSWRSRCWPACRRSRRRSTRPRRIDGATPLAAVPPRHAAAAHADHRGGDDVLGAVHLHRLPADLRADARRPAQRHAPDGDARRSSAPSPAARSAKARRSRSRWCRSCWRRSCSATSACSAAPGSRAASDR